MSRRRVTIETSAARNRLVVRGWKAGDLAREAGCRPVYSGSAGGWMLDLERLSDLVAYLEYRNVAVSVVGAGDDE